MYQNTLPFPRGQTWADGQVTPTASSAADLLGKVYEVPDTVHDTGLMVKVRVVKNDSTAITVARKVVAYGTATNDFGRFANGFVAAAGGFGKPLDDAYTVGASIPANDLFYVVENGPCDVLSTVAASGSVSAGEEVSCGATGKLTTNVAEGQFILGYAMEAIVTNSTGQIFVIENPTKY